MTREEQIYEAADKATYQTPPQYSELVHKSRKVMSAYEVGFIDGCVWADQHHQWIPVEKELPKEKQKVLAYFSPNEKCDHEYACEALYNYGFHHWEDAEDPGVILEGVTHWMPIVPPRKEE